MVTFLEATFLLCIVAIGRRAQPVGAIRLELKERQLETASTPFIRTSEGHNSQQSSAFNLSDLLPSYLKTCPAEAREVKVLERVVPSVTGRFFVITSRASQSQQSGVWPAVVVSSEFQA